MVWGNRWGGRRADPAADGGDEGIRDHDGADACDDDLLDGGSLQAHGKCCQERAIKMRVAKPQAEGAESEGESCGKQHSLPGEVF